MSRTSGKERKSRLRFADTGLFPHCRRLAPHGDPARFVPVSPWSTWMLRSSTPRAISASPWRIESCSMVETGEYPISMPRPYRLTPPHRAELRAGRMGMLGSSIQPDLKERR